MIILPWVAKAPLMIKRNIEKERWKTMDFALSIETADKFPTG